MATKKSSSKSSSSSKAAPAVKAPVTKTLYQSHDQSAAAVASRAPATPAPSTSKNITTPVPASNSMSGGARDVKIAAPSVITSKPAVARTQVNQSNLQQFTPTANPDGSMRFMDNSGFDASGKPLSTATMAATNGANVNAPANAATNVKTTDPKTGLTGNAQMLQNSMAASQKTSDALLNQYTSSLAQYGKTLDANTNSLIGSIGAQFQVRKDAQEQLTAATVAGLTVTGERAGRTRYANEMQTGIITAQEQEGIQALAELDVQEKQLILQARMANDEKKFGLLDKHMNALMENSKQKQVQMMQLYQFSQQEEQMAMQKLRDVQDQSNADRNYQLQAEQFKQSQEVAAREYAATNGITGQFYLVGNTAIDSRTGKAVTLEQYQEMTGQAGKDEKSTDFSKIQNLNDAQTAKWLQDTNRALVTSLAEKYFDAGISLTDTPETAQDKIRKASRIYAEQVRPPSSGGGGGGGGKIPAATKAAMLGSAKQTLADSRGAGDQKYDPGVYLNLRQDYASITGETASFDNTYASGLSPQERANLGIGKAAGIQAEGGTNEDYG